MTLGGATLTVGISSAGSILTLGTCICVQKEIIPTTIAVSPSCAPGAVRRSTSHALVAAVLIITSNANLVNIVYASFAIIRALNALVSHKHIRKVTNFTLHY